MPLEAALKRCRPMRHPHFCAAFLFSPGDLCAGSQARQEAGYSNLPDNKSPERYHSKHTQHVQSTAEKRKSAMKENFYCARLNPAA